VVVFTPPPAFVEIVSPYGDNGRSKEALIKRIVAIEGDVVEVRSGVTYVNGEVSQTRRFENEAPDYEWGPRTVSKGCVMVLGDNRNHSLDSHVWGFLPRENIIGRAVFTYWPLNRATAIPAE
jgi:signal peptidase I